MKRRRAPRGFTLIEAMAVVAVLGVLTALTVGGLEPTVTRLRVAQAAGQVQEALAFARAAAHTSGRCTQVDLALVALPATASNLAQLAAGAQGTVLRVWRARDATCATPATAANSDLLQTFYLPSGTGAAFTTNAAQIWLGNGRLQGNVADHAVVDALGAVTPASQRVTIQPWGPTCVDPSAAAAGACP